MLDVSPGTIVVFADIACPWSHVAAHRLETTRARLGLVEDVRFDFRAFPLELFNSRGTPKRIVDAEIPVVGALEPAAGWTMWQRQDYDYPVTMLLALEAVQAAKEQGLRASESLDRALRVALFGEGRNISLFHEVAALAADCEEVDEGALVKALRDGRARRLLFEQKEEAMTANVEGSPHLFFSDGSDVHNPGIKKRWEGEPGEGFPVVIEDHPEIYEGLLERAART